MKIQIRRGIFETNSSSTHTLTFCMDSDYDKWRLGGKLYDVEEDILVDANSEEVLNCSDKERFISYKQYRERFGEYYNFFSEYYETPNGESVCAFGYYGFD